MKGEVLGTVDHFYWKKEYQPRGTPHYHVFLWIKAAVINVTTLSLMLAVATTLVYLIPGDYQVV